MGKEGESYLDQLLNTVAPDWEETSDSPGKSAEEDVSLEDALSILEDLPDDVDELDDSDAGNADDMSELMELFSSMSDASEEEAGFADEMEAKEEGVTEEKTEEKNEVEEEPKAEEPEMQESSEPEVLPEVSEEIRDVEVPEAEEIPDLSDMMDIPLAEESASMEEEVPAADTEPDIPIMEEEPISEESMAVDDIFQDALSAVAYSGNENPEEDIFSLDEMSDLLETPEDMVGSVPVADPVNGTDSKKGKKKPGFFSKVFGNIVTEQTAEEEEKERQDELEKKQKKAAEKAEKKKQAEISKEEKAQLSQEEKERKKQLKAEKAAEKAEQKAEKKRLKAEREAEAAKEVVGKINPAGATIVIVFFITICVFTVFGSGLLNRNLSLNNAENYFANGEYIKAYNAISGVDLKEDDQTLYRRVRICSQMQKEIKSCQNYTAMGMQVEALDALIKGIGCYDVNKAEAEQLEIMGQLNGLESQLAASLYNDFGLSETQARELLSIPDQAVYTERIQEIVSRIQSVEKQAEE